MLLARQADADPDAILPLLVSDGRLRGEGWLRLGLFLAWFAVAGWLAAGHVMWRDEVRALTLALSGDNVRAMLVAIHGEGHPALWYLLLRGAHVLIGNAALPAVAFAVGASAAALFAWRAPFRPLVIAAVLFSAFCLREYTVLARNYGISMVVMFAFAWAYPRWRERGVGLGVLLALLANTNVPSVLLAGALALFWGVEILCADGVRWTPAWRRYLVNMGVLLLGVLACVAEVYPPFNDAAVSPMAGQLSVGAVLLAAVNVTAPFAALVPDALWTVPVAVLLLAAMVVGGPLGLVRSPGGLAAALTAMVALPLFFQIVYPGGYRHQALYIVLLLTLYWLVTNGHGGRWSARAPLLRPTTQVALQRWGQAAFLALLLTQVGISVGLVVAAAHGQVYSRSRDLAAMLKRDGLNRAVV
ncbi:MAG: hypothetical protein JO157_01235, partial [Acetobacteraceae bacterium]|nr:hypothetical protein [Acetobacteraceae bacterium]